MSWTQVKPGDTVTGSFTVWNNGDSGSELDWKVDSYPSWGTWSSSPSSGDDLQSGCSATVYVTVTAPNEKEKSFDGYIKVVNKEDSSDSDTVSVTLSTPKNRPYIYSIFASLLQKYSFFG